MFDEGQEWGVRNRGKHVKTNSRGGMTKAEIRDPKQARIPDDESASLQPEFPGSAGVPSPVNLSRASFGYVSVLSFAPVPTVSPETRGLFRISHWNILSAFGLRHSSFPQRKPSQALHNSLDSARPKLSAFPRCRNFYYPKSSPPPHGKQTFIFLGLEGKPIPEVHKKTNIQLFKHYEK